MIIFWFSQREILKNCVKPTNTRRLGARKSGVLSRHSECKARMCDSTQAAPLNIARRRRFETVRNHKTMTVVDLRRGTLCRRTNKSDISQSSQCKQNVGNTQSDYIVCRPKQTTFSLRLILRHRQIGLLKSYRFYFRKREYFCEFTEALSC